MVEELQVRIEELEEKNEDLQDDIRGLKYELEEKESEIDDWREEVQDLREELEESKQKIAELAAELQKRPIVYCAKNKSTGKMLTLGGNVVLMHSVQRSAWEDVVWTTEIYTGEQS